MAQASLYHKRMDVWQEKGNHSRAIAEDSRIVEMDPRDSLAYTVREHSWYILRKYWHACSDWKKACELGGSCAELVAAELLCKIVVPGR